MKFKCGRTAQEWEEYRKEQKAIEEYHMNWHKWFAWRPVEVAQGDCRWLEYVERRLIPSKVYYPYYDNFEYRSID